MQQRPTVPFPQPLPDRRVQHSAASVPGGDDQVSGVVEALEDDA
jgi:hypothetical protein